MLKVIKEDGVSKKWETAIVPTIWELGVMAAIFKIMYMNLYWLMY